MSRWKNFIRGQQLTVMFSAIIFLFMFFAMLLVFLGAFALYRFGYIDADRPVEIALVLFALISLLVGVALSVVFSRFPLAPLRELMEATDCIADGDYSARIDLKSPAELKRLSDKFNHMAEEIGSVEMLRSDFINNFSHEFKTPIASIQGFAEMLELECLTEEERLEYLRTIIEEASRLTALATNILINLIDNAIKFSPEGEEIDIVIRESEESLAVSFTNKGEPIPAPALAHIFDKFYQADISHATQGNGLGLAIAQKIARLHGGNITVPCSDTEGTVFEVVLPRK